ncbi:hypothetical protein ACFWEJ_02500 [Promicromonospora sp. NPDC060204]|uniref:hypothetical protein n=1 Tax=Promicromonospora sp. NPDC060204 TaxID=3347071 RepID=UPI0036559209
MGQTPERRSRVDGDALMPLIAGAASGVIAYTIGSGLFVAAVTTVLVGWLAFAAIALINHFRKNR